MDGGVDGDRPHVVGRVARILDLIATAGSAGARLLDLAEKSGMARPTVHRLLQDLMGVGYVQQCPQRRYGLGPALFLLSLNAPSPILDPELMRRVATGLAQQTGDTVYVSIRQFDGVHYLLREEGPYPIKVHAVTVGETRPFTSSYSGIALLAHMDDERRERAIEMLHRDAPAGTAAADPGTFRDLVREKIGDVLREGFVWGPNLVMPGVAGIAAPIPSRSSEPYMAMSISAVEQHMPTARVPELKAILLRAVARMSAAIR